MVGWLDCQIQLGGRHLSLEMWAMRADGSPKPSHSISAGAKFRVHGSERFTIERGASSARFFSMQDWNMLCENGRPNCFIMGYNLGMVTG